MEIRKIIDFAHDEAVRIIKENKDDVILLAKTLIDHEQITAEEIDYLMEHRHLKVDEKPEEKVEPIEEKPVENEQAEEPASNSETENK